MKAGKKILSAVGHAAKAGEDTDERNIEPQIRMHKANKKGKQADKIHSVASSHSPAKSKLKEIGNKLKGLTKEGYEPGDVDEKLGAVTSIPKKDQDAARERILAKTKAKRKMKKEEVISGEETLEEAKKKKCKKGYKRDEDGNCVKEKKSKTTIIIGRGWGYGGGHHHDDDSDDNENNGSGGDSGGEGGSMGEMFDALGDMLLKEKLETGKEYHARMKKQRESNPINPFPVPKGRGKVPAKPPTQRKPDKREQETGGRYSSRYSNSGSD